MKHDGLVVSIAKKYRNKGVSWDELIQAGRIGAWEAEARYDGGIGKFSTYATLYIRRYIIDELRFEGAIVHVQRHHERPDHVVEELTEDVEDRGPGPEDYAPLYAAIARLSPRDQDILFLCFYCNESFSFINRKLGIGSSGEMMIRILRTLRESLGECPWHDPG